MLCPDMTVQDIIDKIGKNQGCILNGLKEQAWTPVLASVQRMLKTIDYTNKCNGSVLFEPRSSFLGPPPDAGGNEILSASNLFQKNCRRNSL